MIMTSTSTAPSTGRLAALLDRYPLTSYFVLAYGLSWLVSLPYILSVWSGVPNSFEAGVQLKQWIGPAVAAMVMAAVIGGRSGLGSLRVTCRRWRVAWPWYVAVLVGAPLLVLAGVLLLFGAPATPLSLKPELLGAYLLYLPLVFIGVGLPEELGWRGFALPRLQTRFGPLGGTLVLGLLWAGWHLPLFLTPDHGGGPNAGWAAVATNFGIFTAMVVAMTVPFTFVFNRTGGSVFITALLHTAIDTPQLVWLPLLLPVGVTNTTSGEGRADLAVLVAFGAVAVLIVALTRGRLGWDRGSAVRDTIRDVPPAPQAPR